MIVWKGIYQRFLVIYSLGNQTDQYKTKQNNSIGLPCLVELGIHTDLSTQSHSLWLENMSGMHHKIQAEGLFWLFIQSNDLPQDCSAQMENFCQTDSLPLRQD